MRYTFKVDEKLKSIINHAETSPEFKAAYGQEPKPSLWLVKDQGVYLMSAGDPAQKKEDGTGCVVAYANGRDPNVGDFDDWWEGGDDFVEALELDYFVDSVKRGAISFTITLSETSLSMKANFPTPKQSKADLVTVDQILNDFIDKKIDGQKFWDLLRDNGIRMTARQANARMKKLSRERFLRRVAN